MKMNGYTIYLPIQQMKHEARDGGPPWRMLQ